jgi:hypothetical protein
MSSASQTLPEVTDDSWIEGITYRCYRDTVVIPATL